MKSQFSSQGRNPAMGRGAFTRGGRGRGMFDAGSPEIIAKILLGFFLGPPGWLWLLYTLVRHISSVGGQERERIACDNRAVVATPSPAEVRQPAPARTTRVARTEVRTGAAPQRHSPATPPPPRAAAAVSSGDELAEAEAVVVSTPATESAPASQAGTGVGQGAVAGSGDLNAPPAVTRRRPPAFKRVTIAAVAPVRRDEASAGCSSATPDGRDAGPVSDTATSPSEPPYAPDDERSIAVSAMPLADDRDTAIVDEPDFLYQEPDEADQEWLVSHEDDLT